MSPGQGAWEGPILAGDSVRRRHWMAPLPPPPWLIGYRSYPIAGRIGIGAMVLVGLYTAARFGAA